VPVLTQQTYSDFDMATVPAAANESAPRAGFWCDECNLLLSDAKILALHRQGGKHRKRVLRLSASQGDQPSAVGVTSDDYSTDVGAIVVPAKLVGSVRSALDGRKWTKRGTHVTHFGGPAATGGPAQKAVHVTAQAATIFNSSEPELRRHIPESMQALLASQQATWVPRLRVGSKECLQGDRPSGGGGSLGRKRQRAEAASAAACGDASRPCIAAAAVGCSDGRPLRPLPEALEPRLNAALPSFADRGTPSGGFRFVELFAGIGGFRVGLESTGGRCTFTSEIDGEARATYANNFPPARGHRHVMAGDITEVEESAVGAHELLTAGFPCQSFSKAGMQRGLQDGRTGALFFEVQAPRSILLLLLL
jgi:hypothetical protein